MANSMGFSANSTLTKWINAEIARRDITKAELFRTTMTGLMNKSKAEAREAGELPAEPMERLRIPSDPVEPRITLSSRKQRLWDIQLKLRQS